MLDLSPADTPELPIEDDRRRRLLVALRQRIDELPGAEIVVPAEVVYRKSAFFYVDAPDLIPRDSAMTILREAIDELIGAYEGYADAASSESEHS